MFRLNGNRWTQALPALLAITFAGPLFVAGQSPEKFVVDPDSTTPPKSVSPALQVSPEQTGDSLASHQRYQAAIAAYSQAPRMTAAIWNKMGISYQMMLNSRDAMRCYKRSLKIEPRNPRVLNNLATVYATTKQFGQADRLYRKALRLQPDNVSILKNLGSNLLSERKYDKGWAVYQQALAIDPKIFANNNNPKVDNGVSVKDRGAMNYYMALGCARAGYTDRALEYLRAALDEGFISREKVAAETSFAGFRSNPGFQRLMAEPSD